MSNQQDVKLPIPDVVISAICTAKQLIQRLAQPWLVQLVLRFALAVPFWKSGILKWHGFLQLNDTAIDLFTQEFQLHLPGGPYPSAARAWVRNPVRRSWPDTDDVHHRTDCTGRLADPSDLGGDGAGNCSLGPGPDID
jgi:hypothetical protein